eukprot:749828-Hanusia_phi.AAC.2
MAPGAAATGGPRRPGPGHGSPPGVCPDSVRDWPYTGRVAGPGGAGYRGGPRPPPGRALRARPSDAASDSLQCLPTSSK